MWSKREPEKRPKRELKKPLFSRINVYGSFAARHTLTFGSAVKSTWYTTGGLFKMIKALVDQEECDVAFC